MHIWCLENWKKYISHECRSGIRIRFDADIDDEVRRSCKEFGKWMRYEYYFPIRVPVYIKNSTYVRANDGDLVYGTFFRPNEYSVEPYIRIAAGDYAKMNIEWGKDAALAAILKTMAHELTHYFQWINNLKLTPIGEERQATQYSRFILDEYAETREHP